MATIKKFVFDQDFDEGAAPMLATPEPEPEPELPPAPPPPPPPPTFSVEELQAQVKMARDQARAAALQEGRVQGMQEAETAAQQELSAAIRAVESALGQLLAVQNQETELRRMNTSRLVLAIIRKLWPGLVARDGLAEIEAVIASFLEELAEEPKLVFRVHERWFEELRGKIGDMALRHGFAGQVTVLADPKLHEMDVKADWSAGGAERDVNALWAEIERIAGDGLQQMPGGPAQAA